MPKRKSCRKFYKELRDNLSREQVLMKSQAICERVFESDEYNKAETIFAYYPLGNEVNCLPIITQALKAGKRVVLPKTTLNCQMDFYEIKSLLDVEEGNFHVMEPKTECELFYPVSVSEKTDNEQRYTKMLVLVPGVVFDPSGNRYGYGKGYYDRYFARFPYLIRMALAYENQVSQETLECLETDVKMQVIVTENETIFSDIR